MSASEFDIIQRFFYSDDNPEHIRVGIGDDAAVISIPAGSEVVSSVDTLNQGVHFLASIPPAALGYKALAINLSDLAAMAATPAWFTLSLSLPEYDEDWLNAFSAGLKKAATQFLCPLVGGDTTRGPLSISIAIHGFVPQGQALLRSGAKCGDSIYVGGTLGESGLGLQALFNQQNNETDNQSAAALKKHIHAHYYPQPQIALGEMLRHFASACVDVSDGFIADLTHLLEASHVGAEIQFDAIPCSLACTTEQEKITAITAGEDYVLCFCVAKDKEAAFLSAIAGQHTVKKVGEIVHERGMKVINNQGRAMTMPHKGWDHFG